MMIRRPKFKAKYHIEDVPREGIFLLSENENHVLEGESLKQIVPLINGINTWTDIIAKVQSYLKEEDMHEAISILIDNGHVVENDHQMPSHFETFWNELGKTPAQAHFLITNTKIQIKTIGNVDSAPFLKALQAFGFNLDASPWPSLIIVIVDDYQHPNLAEVNNYALMYGIPWILVKPSGLRPQIGPFFVPGRTACWQCLESRLTHNREVESYIQRKIKRKEPFPVTRTRVALSEQQVASVTILQLVKWLSLGRNEELESRVICLDIMSLNQSSNYVVRRPQCPACGNPLLATELAAKPIMLHSQKAVAASENGSRLEPPETTFLRYAHHVSPITGIVKGIFPSPWNGVSPLHVYMAGHNFALKNDSLFFLKDSLRSNSSGKGRTETQAQTSALCEALERYSGLFRGEEVRITSSFKKLGQQAVDPRSFLLFSDKQYQESDIWLAKGSRFQIVPLPFNEDAEISWSPLWSWTDKCVKYLPTSCLYYGFQDSDEHFYAWGDSNGNAAGSSEQDAILQGFLELVERDAVAIWWYNRLSRPQVDLESLNDPYFEELKAFFFNAGREFWVLDLTTDTGIPAYAAINRRINHEREDIIMGFGSHLNPRVAVNRAITEMNQFIPAVMTLDENGNAQYTFPDKDAINWWTTATVENQPYLKPSGQKCKIDDSPSEELPDIKAQVEKCFSVAEDLGLEVLLLNQTRPDVGLPVFKVIVPGMRHFWARFAPGRLYEVPLKMGWLDSAKTEEDLNPIAMFL